MIFHVQLSKVFLPFFDIFESELIQIQKKDNEKYYGGTETSKNYCTKSIVIFAFLEYAKNRKNEDTQMTWFLFLR